VIPLTDAEHELLPIQFSVDPGEQFVWGRDEHSPLVAQRLTLAPRERLGLLREYLDVVTVPTEVQQSDNDNTSSASPDLENEPDCEVGLCHVSNFPFLVSHNLAYPYTANKVVGTVYWKDEGGNYNLL
jgi:hypothetical protein